MQQPDGSGGFAPRSVAGRELDGFPFEVIILRVLEGGASFDVAYLDDGNIEREVPREELVPADGTGTPARAQAELDQLWEDGLQQLAAEESAEAAQPRRPTITEQPELGRCVTDDGIVILAETPKSAAAAAAKAAPPAAPPAPAPATAAAKPSVAPAPAPAPVAQEAPAVAPREAACKDVDTSEVLGLAACGPGLRGIRSLRKSRSQIHPPPITA
mmetsp:Transcript_104249/g.261415  ORF Transcript_104249/g.261415 Transcript_104249/m.261415 type:complete len:215 (-) Transcript_104249:20-664(-)